MHFGQILDNCQSPSGHDVHDLMGLEDLISALTTFYVSTDNQPLHKTHMVGLLIISYMMEALKKFIRPLSRKNKKSSKQNSHSPLDTDRNDNADLGKHTLMVPCKH